MTKVTRASLDPPAIRWLREPKFDDDGVQVTSGLDEFSREVPDPVPMSPPIGMSVQVGDPLIGQLRQMVTDELFRQAVAREEFESFEESEDFDVDDDAFPVDPKTPWEAVFDPPSSGGGKSPALAGEAPNGKGGPSEPPTQPNVSASQKASGDLASQVSPEMKAERQSAPSPPVSGAGRS